MGSRSKGEKLEEQLQKALDLDVGSSCKRSKKACSIPYDVLIDILSRVPGSSLIRFKLVCKLWCAITYDTNLIDLHLDRASKADPPRILLFYQDEEQGRRKFHLTTLDATWNPSNGITEASDVILSTPTCNGLVCLYDYHGNIRLCNPTTREFLRLPKPSRDCRNVPNAFPKCFFGFHPETNKYKVVRFFYLSMNHNTNSYNIGCEVFTLGSSSWRCIGAIYCYLTGQGVNADGCIYWTKGATTTIPDRIVALDLKSERFSSIAAPDFSSYQFVVTGPMFLVQLEKKLCVVNAPYDSSGCIDAWMLEDPLKGVWIHRFSVSLNSLWYRWRPEPVFIHNGRVLLRWMDRLFYRSLGEKDVENEDVEHVYTDKCLGGSANVHVFLESLVRLTV